VSICLSLAISLAFIGLLARAAAQTCGPSPWRVSCRLSDVTLNSHYLLEIISRLSFWASFLGGRGLRGHILMTFAALPGSFFMGLVINDCTWDKFVWPKCHLIDSSALHY